ncbi:MAG TPA: DUF3224 domain-containing protein [Jiangellaceae bacterium]
MTQLNTTFEIKSWDERTYREHEDGRKFSRADVALRASHDDVDAVATMENLLLYLPTGHSNFGGLLRIDGQLSGRSGSLVVQTKGYYDGTRAHFSGEIVDATGDFEGATGTVSSTSTHADYPHMPLAVTYQLP